MKNGLGFISWDNSNLNYNLSDICKGIKTNHC